MSDYLQNSGLAPAVGWPMSTHIDQAMDEDNGQAWTIRQYEPRGPKAKEIGSTAGKYVGSPQ